MTCVTSDSTIVISYIAIPVVVRTCPALGIMPTSPSNALYLLEIASLRDSFIVWSKIITFHMCYKIGYNAKLLISAETNIKILVAEVSGSIPSNYHHFSLSSFSLINRNLAFIQIFFQYFILFFWYSGIPFTLAKKKIHEIFIEIKCQWRSFLVCDTGYKHLHVHV